MVAKFSDYLKEEVKSMTRKEFISKIEESFKKYFPNGDFLSYKETLSNADSIIFSATLFGGGSVIRMNDPLQMVGDCFESVDDNGIMKDKIDLEWSQASLAITPKDGSPHARKTIKLGLRKKTGNVNVVLKAIDSSFKKAAGVVIDNIDIIYKVDEIDKKYLKVIK